MGFKSQHSRRSRQNILGDQVFPDNGDYHACRADIFLYSAIQNAVFAHLYRFGEETGRYVCYQGFSFCIWKLFELCSIDSIVLTDIYVIRIRTDGKVRTVRYIRICFVFGRCDFICLSVFLGLLPCLFCPLACNDIICHPILHKVHGNHGELLAGSSLKKQYLIIFRNF